MINPPQPDDPGSPTEYPTYAPADSGSEPLSFPRLARVLAGGLLVISALTSAAILIATAYVVLEKALS